MFVSFSHEDNLLYMLIVASNKNTEYLIKARSMWEPVCTLFRSLSLPLGLEVLGYG